MAKDTIMVFSKEDQREICIARQSFNPELHEYVNAEDARLQEPAEAPAAVNSDIT